MLNRTILIKVKQRLNKLDSQDYDNIEQWQILEAFNKAEVVWCRRNLHGINQLREGDEQSKRRIDDLQILLNTESIAAHERNNYYETDSFPENYFEWKRVSCNAINECCPKRPMIVYLAEEGNLDIFLADENKKPSFDWAETFATIKNNRIFIYTNNEFEVKDARLTYYRQPRRIEMVGVVNSYTGIGSTQEVECEFKDDLIELMIDETSKIISGDIESFNQSQRASVSVEGNN
jgi:hypothetical protein